MLRIGMLTSGGDCQALNAAMRGVVKGICSKRDDVEIFGFQDGYKGLIYGDFKMLTSSDFSGILTRGGTIRLRFSFSASILFARDQFIKEAGDSNDGNKH